MDSTPKIGCKTPRTTMKLNPSRIWFSTNIHFGLWKRMRLMLLANRSGIEWMVKLRLRMNTINSLTFISRWSVSGGSGVQHRIDSVKSTMTEPQRQPKNNGVKMCSTFYSCHWYPIFGHRFCQSLQRSPRRLHPSSNRDHFSQWPLAVTACFFHLTSYHSCELCFDFVLFIY